MSAGGVSAQQLAEIEARLKALPPGALTVRTGVISDTSEFLAHAPSDVAVLVEAVRELRAALEPFARLGNHPNLAPNDAECDLQYGIPSPGELRRAAAVLGTRQEGL